MEYLCENVMPAALINLLTFCLLDSPGRCDDKGSLLLSCICFQCFNVDIVCQVSQKMLINSSCYSNQHRLKSCVYSKYFLTVVFLTVKICVFNVQGHAVALSLDSTIYQINPYSVDKIYINSMQCMSNYFYIQ